MPRSQPHIRTPRRRRFLRLALACVAAIPALAGVNIASAQDVSAPATLQFFEASHRTIEKRAADIFMAGYGAIWVPPPYRADQGDWSVGYDVYDRFDLGSAGKPTLYGTRTGMQSSIREMRKIGVQYYADLIWNHNGFSDTGTPGFQAAGGYPGFVLSRPDDVDGDFHGRFESGDIKMRLAGLIDIAQQKNYQYIRHPVNPNDTRNLPAGTTPAFGRLANVPTASNAQFYPNRSGSPARMLFDPKTGESNIPVWDFDAANPMSGTAVPENALGLLMRHAQWMIQVIGVDGFRLDATKHMEPWVLNYLDRAVYKANPRLLLDGSRPNPFSFGETYDGNMGFLQQYVRKDINPNDPGRIGGNRDTKDFPLYFAMRDNLSSNGLANDWRNVINASFDRNDDGLGNNGSQGVAFAQSHDDFGPYLTNVAHAYMLMRPGNAIVYMNAKEFGNNRDFPKDGRGDALGGLYGNRLTTLVNIRNTHGRGNFIPRLTEKETLVYERDRTAVVALSNRVDSGFDSRSVLTNFAPGTALIELTGNAADASVDPNNDIPELLIVNPDRTINFRVPRNRTGNNTHGRGYVIYGLGTPQGTLTLSNVASVLAPETPTAATNGTARLTPISVITADNFDVKLQTNPVFLLGFHRDPDADGDNALIRINNGLDLNGNGQVDHRTPNTTAYGFENFTTVRSPLTSGGTGEYRQTIDASQLAEGYNYITVRAYRKRTDGGPAVFSDFREVVYVDRYKPMSVVDSFVPWNASQPENRDLIIRSTDQTAEKVHVFLNVPASVGEGTILSWVGQGNQAGQIDRDLFKYGFFNVQSGNNVATIVTYEITGNYNVQRLPMIYVANGRGRGLGDLNANGQYEVGDVTGTGYGMEALIYPNLQGQTNLTFNPGADINGDGLLDSRDLYAVEALYRTVRAPQSVRDATRDAVLRRGNVNGQFGTDAWDIDFLFAAVRDNVFNWRNDLDVDLRMSNGDVNTLVTTILLTAFGDANLDGVVDKNDLQTLYANYGNAGGWAMGDFNGDGVVNDLDREILRRNIGFPSLTGPMFVLPVPPAGPGPISVPEPSAAMALMLAGVTLLVRRRGRSI